MKKLLCIVGPTATGKTDLAISLATKTDGVLISADAVQVFKKLNIISGKDLPDDTHFISGKGGFGHYAIGNISIYLLDLVAPTQDFSVAEFSTQASSIIQYICSEKKLPIVVGGTGLYVKSLVDGIDTSDVPRDNLLRSRLQEYSTFKLQTLLQKKDKKKFDFMNNSDKNNPRRLVRAIEIAIFGEKRKEKKVDNYDVLFIGLLCDRDTLKKRIDARVEKRMEQGAVTEAKTLFKNYQNLSNQVKTANGYRQLFGYLLGEYSFGEAIEKWKISEYLHAKNQMTWFGKDKRIHWYNILDKEFHNKLEKEVLAWYNRKVKL